MNVLKSPLLLSAALLVGAPLLFAQNPAGYGPLSMHGGPMDHARSPRHEGPHGDEILPGGMWWKDPKVVAAIGVSPDQQKHMEDLFIQSRTQLIQLHANLEQQQLLLGPMLEANPVDQPKALAQIDKIANSRADLEKANAKMLLSIRGVLTPEQWTKLQALHGPGHGPHDARGSRGPHGQQGPGGPQGPMPDHNGPFPAPAE